MSMDTRMRRRCLTPEQDMAERRRAGLQTRYPLVRRCSLCPGVNARLFQGWRRQHSCMVCEVGEVMRVQERRTSAMKDDGVRLRVDYEAGRVFATLPVWKPRPAAPPIGANSVLRTLEVAAQRAAWQVQDRLEGDGPYPEPGRSVDGEVWYDLALSAYVVELRIRAPWNRNRDAWTLRDMISSMVLRDEGLEAAVSRVRYMGERLYRQAR